MHPIYPKPCRIRLTKIVLAALIIVFTNILSSGQSLPVDSIIRQIQIQLNGRLKQFKPTGLYPRSFNVAENKITFKSADWTSGFFPGMLWYMYDYTRDTYWIKQAERWTSGLEFEKFNTRTHDLGFILFCSFGNGYRLFPRPHYREVLIQGAKSLISRYNPSVGCIRSWDHGEWKYPVIIDNMMNLELLFWASKITGDDKYARIAINHANTTLKNHFRVDGSSYHVIDYNSENGDVISRTTAQGYSDESSWARGQAWGLYGFTIAFRETGDKNYLEHAEKIAHYIISNLPKNKIPYWDFNAPNIPFEFQDASAAAITASALIELSQYGEEVRNIYLKTAEEIILTLSSPAFFAKKNTNGDFSLMHSVGTKPKNSEVNVPVIYADYYFLEALIRYKKYSNQN
jgi:unsaturated chondroitin disaccharide hydrolase